MQQPRLALVPPAHARVGMVLVALPALESRPANAEETWAVALEVAPESPVEPFARFFAGDGGVPEIEGVLAVDVGQIHVEQPTLFGHVGIKRRPRHGRI